jgi:hypothetical protein
VSYNVIFPAQNLTVLPVGSLPSVPPPQQPVGVPNVDTIFALGSGRKPFHQQHLDEYDRANIGLRPADRTKAQAQASDANLISSELDSGMHKPVLDLDFPAFIVESSTPGHGHLYIEQELTWDQYKALLDGFLAAGLIQKAWYQNAIKDKRSYVRLPHVRKPKAP